MKGAKNDSKVHVMGGIIRRISTTPPMNLFLDPYFLARRALLLAISFEAKNLASGKILDVGCGSKPYQSLFSGAQYTGIDIENPGHDHSREEIDVYYDGSTLPFGAATFDSVLCFQVLEHVFTPDDFLTEIHRVLKPGGLVLLTVPLIWNEHEQPQDYARYTSFGLRHLLTKNKLEPQRQDKLNPGIAALCQLINAFFAASFRRTPMAPLLPLIFAGCNVVGWVASKFPGRDATFYLDNLMVAKKECERL